MGNRKDRREKAVERLRRRWSSFSEHFSLQSVIWISFTLTALAGVLLMGVSFYNRFSTQLRISLENENQTLIDVVNSTTSTYLRNVMKVSDALNYSVIKKSDLDQDEIAGSFQLLYDTNKDSIHNIALFSMNGKLLQAAPAAVLREGTDVRLEEWFIQAARKTENIHFGIPVVEHLLSGTDTDYDWVIPVSRVVQITQGNRIQAAVLLINLSYTSLADIFSSVQMENGSYIYLIDQDGKLIYHPRQELIVSGLIHENNLAAAQYRDHNYDEVLDGEKRSVAAKSVGYTGWKIIGVTPQRAMSLNSLKSKLFIAFLFGFFILVISLLNSAISNLVSEPIHDLEESVRHLEEGNLDTPIHTGGFLEVRHLGTAIQNMASHIKELMKDIMLEHQEKRKSELNALQSQINPHFLYNTLDIIVWMIENERPGDAVRVVTALARFFRISLSRGKVIITVEDELEHVRNYLMIQEMRFKNKFHYRIEAQPEVNSLGTIKLILQPMVENAIYHAMEFMDGDGEVLVTADVEGNELFFRIRDNGCGMPQDVVEQLVHGDVQPSSSGSGVGIKNVQERIKLYFGREFGLMIDSEPDVGTTVILHMPAVPYQELKERGLE